MSSLLVIIIIIIIIIRIIRTNCMPCHKIQFIVFISLLYLEAFLSVQWFKERFLSIAKGLL